MRSLHLLITVFAIASAGCATTSRPPEPPPPPRAEPAPPDDPAPSDAPGVLANAVAGEWTGEADNNGELDGDVEIDFYGEGEGATCDLSLGPYVDSECAWHVSGNDVVMVFDSPDVEDSPGVCLAISHATAAHLDGTWRPWAPDVGCTGKPQRLSVDQSE